MDVYIIMNLHQYIKHFAEKRSGQGFCLPILERFYVCVNRRQAAASSCKVLQETMGVSACMVCTERI